MEEQKHNDSQLTPQFQRQEQESIEFKRLIDSRNEEQEKQVKQLHNEIKKLRQEVQSTNRPLAAQQRRETPVGDYDHEIREMRAITDVLTIENKDEHAAMTSHRKEIAQEIRDLKTKIDRLSSTSHLDDIRSRIDKMDADRGRTQQPPTDFERTAKELRVRIDETGDMSQKEFVRLKERLKDVEVKPGNFEEELGEFKRDT